MKFLIIISSFIVVQGLSVGSYDDAVKIKGNCYGKEILHEGLASYPLAVDYASNTLYFSYGKDEDTAKAAKFNIDTKEFEVLEGIDTGFAQTVDPKTHDVYFGGSFGIYKYNPNTKKAELLGNNNTSIWSIFFKDTLYYTVSPFQVAYTFTDGKAEKFSDLKDTTAQFLIIDNEDDMFYYNDTGLYSQKKGTKDAVLYRDFSKNGNETPKGLNMDVNGDVYISFDHGIYEVKKETKSLEKVFDFEYSEGNGIAFDRDNNIIYGDTRSKIIRLKPNKDITC